MDMDFDTLVIGGGIAGVAAALEAAAAGERVAVVRAGPGATALTSGAWHGPLPPHLAAALAASGLPYLPASAPLPHPHGTLVSAPFAAASHAAARLDGDTCVLGIAGLPSFPAAALARMWGTARHVLATLADTPPAGWSPVALAARLDRDPSLLAEAVRSARAARVIAPAVLGLDRPSEVRRTLHAETGVEVAEALGVPPSIPGWRLDRALLAALERAGITLVAGRVTGRTAAGTRLLSIQVSVAGDVGDRTLPAHRFILATGRFVGGGVTAADVTDAVDVAHGRALREAGLVERALGCDVWIDHLGQRFTRVQPVPLTDPARAEAQALLQAGVHVDALGRPLSVHGDVCFENVRARGGVVAQTRHGLGDAALPPAQPEVAA